MRVLVTGGAGYLGSRVVPRLLLRGHDVRIVDSGPAHIGQLPANRHVEVLSEDLRNLSGDDSLAKKLLDGCDCAIHLAAVSSDSRAEKDPVLTEEVNVAATVALAQEARQRGARFLFSSTCALYGNTGGELDESSPTEPLSGYSASKLRAEAALLDLASEVWSPVILRNGTLFGYSPRMRFDLVVNIFCLNAMRRHEIKVFGSGSQWRPFLHVDDCARAFVFFAERLRPFHAFYNVSHGNYTVKEVAQMFADLLPDLEVSFAPVEVDDDRDYRVSTRRLEAEGFLTKVGVSEGAEELMQAIVMGLVTDPEADFRRLPKWDGAFERS